MRDLVVGEGPSFWIDFSYLAREESNSSPSSIGRTCHNALAAL